MAQISVSYFDSVQEYLRPRYLSWPVANGILYVLVVWNLEEIVVEPGQGGTVAVYIWPTYWASYHLQDAMFGSLPEYTWTSLILNYVLGIVPLYVATNLGLNVTLPPKYKTWRPSLSRYAWAGVFLLLVLTFIPVHLFGFLGIILWVVIASTSLVTVVGSKIHSALRRTEWS